MAYRNNNYNNQNNGGNNNYYVVTKSGIQFYNQAMEDENDQSTLSFSFWKDKVMFTINPIFTKSERKQLEASDKRVFNYDVSMSIAINVKQAYKLLKGINLLEKNAEKLKSIAVATDNKVIKIGTGADLNLAGHWYIGIFNKDSADGLLYFFNKSDDDLLLDYNEETQQAKKTYTVPNVEIDIIKMLLAEMPLLLSKGTSHECRQELSNLKKFIDGKLSGGSTTTSRNGGSTISNRRRRPVQEQPVNQQPSELDDLNLEDDSDVPFSESKEDVYNDISQLEDDFLNDADFSSEIDLD